MIGNSWKPWSKPKNKPLYVDIEFVHPSNNMKHIPSSISTWLSSDVGSQSLFSRASKSYNENLNYDQVGTPTKFHGKILSEEYYVPTYFNSLHDISVETKVS